jgi:hypothetical protein
MVRHFVQVDASIVFAACQASELLTFLTKTKTLRAKAHAQRLRTSLSRHILQAYCKWGQSIEEKTENKTANFEPYPANWASLKCAFFLMFKGTYLLIKTKI